MLRNDLHEILKDGFNIALLAEAFDCSVGRINELKRQPVEGKVYHAADINTDALYDFAEKHSIDLDSIDFAPIVAAKAKKEAAKIEVGTMTKEGPIVAVQKIGNTNVYSINTINGVLLYSLKEVKQLLQ